MSSQLNFNILPVFTKLGGACYGDCSLVVKCTVVVRESRVRFSAFAYLREISPSDVYPLSLRSFASYLMREKLSFLSKRRVRPSLCDGQPDAKNFYSPFVSLLRERVDDLTEGRFLTNGFFGDVRW